MNEIIVTARASSLPTLADCGARWAAQVLEGLSMPSGPRAYMGSAIHASTARHDQARIDGNPLRADESAAAAVDYLREHADEVDWTAAEDNDDLRPREVEAITLSLHGRYCSQIAPTRNYTVVEADLGALEIETESGVVIRLTGHSDRERIEGGAAITSDLKSSARAVSAAGVVDVKGHAFQLATYKLLSHSRTGLPMHRKAEIIGLNTGKRPESQRVGIGFAEDVEETLLGTADRPGLLHALGYMVKHDAFIGNPKSSLCSPKFCPIYHRCHFRK